MKLFGYELIFKKIAKPDYSKNFRRSGESTRLIDKHIQTLFKTGEVTVFDHYPGSNAAGRVFMAVLRRLEAEHNLNDKHLHVSHGNFLIRLKECI